MLEKVQKTSRATISLTTGLDIPKSVVYFDIGCDRKVAVADEFGNWLVLTGKQSEQLETLREGHTLGDVLGKYGDSGQVEFKKLIAQIYARSFFQRAEPVLVPQTNQAAFFCLTYACNLACSHCYMYNEKMLAPILTVSEYRNIFSALKEIGIRNLTFSGGEPLLVKNFKAIVVEAKVLGFNIAVFSNGTLWNDELVAFASKNITAVQISIDGTSEAACSIVRGSGVFDKALKTVYALAKAGVEVTIATTPQVSTADEIRKNYVNFTNEVTKRSDAPIYFRLSTKVLKGRGCGATDEYLQQSLDLAEQVYDNNTAKIFAVNHKPNAGLNSCGFGGLNFTPDGFVYPCNRISDCSPIANVREMAINQIYSIGREINKRTSIENTIPCCKCALRYLCGGGCRLDNYRKLSSTNEPSFHKECSESMKRALLIDMVKTTKFLYRF